MLELDIRLYKEESVELLSDLYSTGCEVVSEQGEVCFDRLLTRNSCKMRVGGSVSFQKPDRILQICHSSGIVRLDESRPSENGLAIEGVLEVSLLYLTMMTRRRSGQFLRFCHFPARSRRRGSGKTASGS